MNSCRNISINLLRWKLCCGAALRVAGINLRYLTAGTRILTLLSVSGCGSFKQKFRFSRRVCTFHGLTILIDFVRAARTPSKEWKLNLSAGEDTLNYLHSEKAIRLQRTIAKHFIERQYGIRPEPFELEVLSRCASVGAASGRLIRAAGCGSPTTLNREDLFRCRTVFPAFIRLLNLDMDFRERNPVPEPPLSRFRIKLRRSLSLPRRTRQPALPQLYPRELDRERREFERTSLLARYCSSKAILVRTFTSELFRLYLDAMQLIIENPPSKAGLHNIEPLLNRLERMHTKSLNHFREENYGYME
ncbi:hypothetical protein B4O97_04165 [Marispirochaeta aestuarii]|uniref:Uncharacterized protein n=1 Tax=Marispirochaeta aestuarii TaxID=1963862 RepID=A0A1Y1S1T5_9SPIO|nr:hypothetical protein [Marispirochaeta aestuarii]ORC37393.1 hypothetical protein B4O97_04165 [Marispirochaeta aestuarii]